MAKNKELNEMLWQAVGVLSFAGGLTWVSIGLFDFNIVQQVSFDVLAIENTIYVAAGAAGAWLGVKQFMN